MNEDALNRLILKDTAFQDLMQKRIHSVLMVASPYDAFMMEEDGRIEEQLYFEYVSLNLSAPPRVTQVADPEAAIKVMGEKKFDLVIMMPGADMVSETMSGAKAIKEIDPNVPVVVLTPFSREVSRRLAKEDLSAVDYVFSWLGNVDLLLAIIKLLEDRMNAEYDINTVGVQMILLVWHMPSRTRCGSIRRCFPTSTRICSSRAATRRPRRSMPTSRCCACAGAQR